MHNAWLAFYGQLVLNIHRFFVDGIQLSERSNSIIN